MFIAGLGKAVDSTADLLGTRGAQVSQYGPIQDTEPYLDLVQPKRMCRRIVEADPPMTGKPTVVLGLVLTKLSSTT